MAEEPNDMSIPGVGILGLGTAGASMLSAALRHANTHLTAVADLRVMDLPLERLSPIVKRHESIDELLADPSVDIVHIATPTALHLEHVSLALAAGKHVIVEKPMAADLRACDELVRTAAASGRHVIVGHSQSYDPYVQAAAVLARLPDFGDVVSITSTKFTDWIRRPRLPEELEWSLGGGILHRQGVHQTDIVRTILGGGVLTPRQVRLRVDPVRNITGSYLVWLESDSGATVLLTYDGVGGTINSEMAETMRSLPLSGGDETENKRRRTDGQLRALLEGTFRRTGAQERGEIVVLGTTGEIVATTEKVFANLRSGIQVVDTDKMPDGRTAVLDEMAAAINGTAPMHTPEWGYENIRVCEEIQALGSR